MSVCICVFVYVGVSCEHMCVYMCVCVRVFVCMDIFMGIFITLFSYLVGRSLNVIFTVEVSPVVLGVIR